MFYRQDVSTFSRNYKHDRKDAYLASLLRLVGLPLLELGLNLLNNSGNVRGAGGGVDSNKSAVLDNRRGDNETLGGGAGGLLGLLALLGGGQILILSVLLAHKSSALDARAVDLALGLGTETLVGENVRLLGTWCCCWDAERKRER